MAIDLKSRIEDRINRGLLGQWYPVCKSIQVNAGRPRAVTALGRQLVLWRGANHSLNCLEDFCPHRGAPFSRGEVNDGNLSCRYHGVTLDGTGRILRVPAMPECALEGRKAVAAFATTEARDAIFVYFPKADEAAPPLELPEELTSGDWTDFLCTARWHCNYRYALDNLADPMHGCYVHADSFTLAFGAKQDTMKVAADQDRLRRFPRPAAGREFRLDRNDPDGFRYVLPVGYSLSQSGGTWRYHAHHRLCHPDRRGIMLRVLLALAQGLGPRPRSLALPLPVDP